MNLNTKLISKIMILTLIAGVHSANSSSDMMRRRGNLQKPAKRDVGVSSSSRSSRVDQGDIATVVQSQNSNKSSYTCTVDDQTTIPLKDLLGQTDLEEFEISHDPKSGRLTLNAGRMLTNCKDMFSLEVIEPTGSVGMYLLKAQIRKPSNCDEDGLCEYTAVRGEAGMPLGKDKNIKIKVKPTLEGYYECLKLAEVYGEDNSYNSDKEALSVEVIDKVLPTDFSGELAFYSHGPIEGLEDPVYGKIKVDGKGACDNFQQIVDGGFNIISKEDQFIREKEKEFRIVCGMEDYRAIGSKADSFLGLSGELDYMYPQVKDLERFSLEQAVKSLKEKINDNKSDLSDLDAKEFERVTRDFYGMIINPLRKEIEDKYFEMKSAKGDNKDQLDREMSRLTEKLLSYYKGDFLTPKEYELMKDFAAKAPLDKEAWRKAALNFYEGNATALSYARYSKKMRDKNGFELASPSVANREIDDLYADEKDFVNKLGELAENPKRSHANNFYSEVNNIATDASIINMGFEQDKQFVQQQMYNNCRPNQYGYQQCLERYYMEIEDLEYSQQRTGQFYQREMGNIQNQAQLWAQIEATRNGGKVTQQTRTNPGVFDFSFEVPQEIRQMQQQRMANQMINPNQQYRNPNNQQFFDPRQSYQYGSGQNNLAATSWVNNNPNQFSFQGNINGTGRFPSMQSQQYSQFGPQGQFQQPGYQQWQQMQNNQQFSGAYRPYFSNGSQGQFSYRFNN